RRMRRILHSTVEAFLSRVSPSSAPLYVDAYNSAPAQSYVRYNISVIIWSTNMTTCSDKLMLSNAKNMTKAMPATVKIHVQTALETSYSWVIMTAPNTTSTPAQSVDSTLKK